MADKVFTVGNYPVEARAQDAVAAKERALADGQQAAFRSLLKRLVPVTAYRRLAGLKAYRVADLVDAVAVRSERNSQTEYFATLDFSFQPNAVRNILRDANLPFVDTQAPVVTLVPVYRAPSAVQGAPGPILAELAQAAGTRTWTEAWKSLDLDHALSPLKLEPPSAGTAAETVDKVRDGDIGALGALAAEHRSDLILLAFAEPDLAAGKLTVTLTGQDAVGTFVLRRGYRLQNDFAYASESAAVVGLRILEGRWKAVSASARSDADAPRADMETVRLRVEFDNLRQWQELQALISRTPGVEDFNVEGLLSRGADVSLKFPGGGEALADALSAQGVDLSNRRGVWLARPRH